MAYTIDPVINGQRQQQIVKVGDTLPIGTEVDYEGAEVPNGWEEVADPNEYSTTEQVVGKWIDGKPLYRKVLDFGALPNASEKSIPHNIANLKDIIKLSAISKSSGVYFPIPLGSSASLSANIYILAVSEYITIGTGSDRSTFTQTYVIIEYTKTTD